MKDINKIFEYVDMTDIWDYEKMKDRLMIKLCDPELKQEYLEDKIYTMHEDFTATYCLVMHEGKESDICVPVTEALMKAWGILLERLHKDAILADKSREPILFDLNEVFSSEPPWIKQPKNLLMKGAEYHPRVVPLLCLSNGSKRYGASMILHDDVMRRAGEILGSDFYVLPSSVHETIFVPDMGGKDVSELSLMVKEINETEVEPYEKLSDKVQHYDCKKAVLENAEERERRISLGTERREIKRRLSDAKEEMEGQQCPFEKGENIEKRENLFSAV